MSEPRELIYKTILEEMGFQALDEIQSIELARKVGQGAAERINHIVDSRNALLKPANLIGSILAASVTKSVRSFERERCAKIAEDAADEWMESPSVTARTIAERIRERR